MTTDELLVIIQFIKTFDAWLDTDGADGWDNLEFDLVLDSLERLKQIAEEAQGNK